MWWSQIRAGHHTHSINLKVSTQNTNFVYILYSEKKMKFQNYGDSDRGIWRFSQKLDFAWSLTVTSQGL